MNKVLGIEYYSEYKANLDRIRKTVMENRSENDVETSVSVSQIDNKLKEIEKYHLIVLVALLIMLGPIGSILNYLSRFDLIWIAGIPFGVLLFSYIFFEVKYKKNKRKIIKKHQEIEQIELEKVTEYKQKQDEIYHIVVFIITLNKFRYKLCKKNTNIDEKEWQKLTLIVTESINRSMNYNINASGYEMYLLEWLKNVKDYG